ncbi:MAG TPA: hypothetical protein VF017_23285 [Thermoanaerobaculia bacterium]|nr:hypothetical protein [Thermoanaerobaculia bacterium]
MNPADGAPGWRPWLLGLAAFCLLAVHLLAVATEGINWDELALLQRAQRTLATGILESGGRPGLVVVALLPWVDGCSDAVTLAREIRYAWVGLTLLMLAGLYAFVRRAAPAGEDSAGAAALAVGVLALAPAFLRWSLQIRTDQPALAGALWGGVLLLASRERRRLAPLAGVLFGLGTLCSQKALYGVALVGVVAALFTVSDLRSRPIPWRRVLQRDLLRGLGVVVGFAAAVGLYRFWVWSNFTLPQASAVDRGLEAFAFYRERLGLRAYWRMAPTLWPQGLLLVLLVAATVSTAVRRLAAPGLAAAWACLGLGMAVGAFHAAAFPYFWMTLGLFPAAAIGLGWGTLTRRLPPGRGRLLEAAAWLALLAPNLAPALARLTDTQRVQRESLAFVARNFPADALGYQVEGALLCRQDPRPLPRLLSHQIFVTFTGEGSEARQRAFLEQFRRRPVSFLVSSFRFESFPEGMQEFWRSHYVAYRWAVLVAGVRARARPGTEREIDLVAGGRYRLHGPEGGPPLRLELDGRPLDSSGASAPATLDLAAGTHRLRFLEGEGLALLTLDLPEAPGAIAEGFYPEAQVSELRGLP